MATSTAEPITFERPVNRRDLLAARTAEVRFLDIPDAAFLAVDGTGAPGGTEFGEAFGALYPVAYTLHFALKRRGVDAPVGALEGLFWIGDPGPITPAQFGSVASGAPDWHWRLMLPAPEAATDADIASAIDAVAAKKAPPALARLHVERLAEGASAQILHVGPYSAEPPTIERLHAAISAAGLRPRGCHHEIYLSDPGRTAPERLKTVIRQPVLAAG